MKASILDRVLPEAVNDARLVQIVGRHLQLHPVAHGEADESLAHAARDVSEHGVLVCQFNAEHRSSEDCGDFSFGFNRGFYSHESVNEYGGLSRMPDPKPFPKTGFQNRSDGVSSRKIYRAASNNRTRSIGGIFKFARESSRRTQTGLFQRHARAKSSPGTPVVIGT